MLQNACQIVNTLLTLSKSMYASQGRNKVFYWNFRDLACTMHPCTDKQKPTNVSVIHIGTHFVTYVYVMNIPDSCLDPVLPEAGTAFSSVNGKGTGFIYTSTCEQQELEIEPPTLHLVVDLLHLLSYSPEDPRYNDYTRQHILFLQFQTVQKHKTKVLL